MDKIFNKQLSTPLFLLLFGLLFFAIGSGLTYQQRRLEKQGIEVQGVVIRLQENYDSDSSTYAPVVHFTTNSGQNVEFITSYYSSPPDYEVGEQVLVVYSPEQPEKAVIKGDGQLLHIIFMLVGGVVASISAYMMYSSFRDVAILSPEA